MRARSMRLTAVLLAVFGSLLLMDCKGKATPPPREAAKDSGVVHTTSRLTVLLVGTSITAGYGLPASESWTSLVQARIDSARLPFVAVNAGVSGETSAGALHRLEWLLGQGPATVIVLETGANDGLRGQSVDSLRRNIDVMLTRLQSSLPLPIVLLAAMEALPNMGAPYVTAFRAIYPDLAHAHHVTLLPFLLAGVAGVDSLNQGDGLHPNALGSRRVARNVWATLGPILDSVARARPE